MTEEGFFKENVLPVLSFIIKLKKEEIIDKLAEWSQPIVINLLSNYENSKDHLLKCVANTLIQFINNKDKWKQIIKLIINKCVKPLENVKPAECDNSHKQIALFIYEFIFCNEPMVREVEKEKRKIRTIKNVIQVTNNNNYYSLYLEKKKQCNILREHVQTLTNRLNELEMKEKKHQLELTNIKNLLTQCKK